MTPSNTAHTRTIGLILQIDRKNLLYHAGFFYYKTRVSQQWQALAMPTGCEEAVQYNIGP
jgi:hypothetical protein